MPDRGRPIRRLGGLFFTLFMLLALDLGYWQVLQADWLQNNVHNPRKYTAEEQIHRGTIYDRHHQPLASTIIDAGGFAHRVYSDTSLAETIGYYNLTYGAAGIEGAYQDQLAGGAATDAARRLLDQLLHRPQVGNNVQLTIDRHMQDVADAVLTSKIAGGHPGVVLLADPHTGAILAMASEPHFDLAKINDPDYWKQITSASQAVQGLLLNRATQGLYPPGSTFKTVTLSAMLDLGMTTLSSTISGADATNDLYVDGSRITGNNLPARLVGRTITVEQSYAYSDNIAFARNGLALGKDHFLTYTQRFGVGQPIPFDLPTSTSVIVRNPADLNNVLLAPSAFGQGQDQMTPLQMLLVAEAVANNGTIMRPYLVSSITAPDGTVISQTQPSTFAQPISAATAAQMRKAMLAVCAYGWGWLATSPRFSVAGKTGTAQLDNGPPDSWFIGYAPANHPQVAIVVMVERGGESYSVAAPMARQVLEGVVTTTP